MLNKNHYRNFLLAFLLAFSVFLKSGVSLAMDSNQVSPNSTEQSVHNVEEFSLSDNNIRELDGKNIMICGISVGTASWWTYSICAPVIAGLIATCAGTATTCTLAYSAAATCGFDAAAVLYALSQCKL